MCFMKLRAGSPALPKINKYTAKQPFLNGKLLVFLIANHISLSLVLCQGNMEIFLLPPNFHKLLQGMLDSPCFIKNPLGGEADSKALAVIL